MEKPQRTFGPVYLEKNFQTGALVSVLTTEPLNRFLDYKAPEGGCDLGSFLEVPLGPRKVLGVVWSKGSGTFDINRIRSAYRELDVAPMTEDMRQFLERAAEYTLTPLSAMLRLATRAPGLSNPPSMQKVYRLADASKGTQTKARAKVVEVINDFGGARFTLSELASQAGVSASVIKGMVQAGSMIEEQTPRDLPFPDLHPDQTGKALTSDQSTAAQALREKVRQGGYGTTLLRGVTGSGKTEVYLEAVAECLKQGQQALVLLPEIALTSEFMKRVEARFGARPAEWHSGVTMTERRRTWKMVGEGGAQMVIGARSALFLPFRSLGLVVVDEEHEGSYKQEEGALYHARDMSVLRASLAGAQVVLASATPSLETWANAQSGKYDRVDLTSRYGAAVMPDMKTIDMRAEKLPASRWVSDELARQIAQRIEAGEQSLLFINRRGFAPVTLCRACGEQLGCETCDALMVEHRFQKRLMCHQCGETKPIPQTCPACGVADRLAPVGPGVERLAEEAQSLFPEARLRVLSSDLFGSARALKQAIDEIAAGDADIIVGTQLVAKGHNFPKLTLVGVIDADLGLQGSDLRAAERTFQLMRQVAGRAGRSETPGTAYLQTYQPDHPVIHAIVQGDEEAFWKAEAREREAIGMPPFGRMAGIVISSTDLALCERAGLTLARNTAELVALGAQVFGPAPAPIARVRGRYRVRLLIKAGKAAPIQAVIARWVAQVPLQGDLRIAVDIDPYSFL